MTRVQADMAAAVKDWLATQDLGADVRLVMDEDWKPSDGPVLIVADDGGPVVWPVKSRHTIRLTGYADGRTTARAIVALAAGKLAESSPRPPGVANVSSQIGGVLDARDKATGAFLASVLVPVHARTVEA
ncbi:hypothetical protein [Mycolicibacterium elephantis]|uniref:hypothetical protein n=1 Tax=Mycolicibacterium elephantis TaxID=81858 RepID=UPI0007EBC85D|nr:hypothetical protein [Mycolicibacterium elephantis]OBB20612.1 hypothetical protein A5762_15250 [Mycolicibacterium elephantis]